MLKAYPSVIAAPRPRLHSQDVVIIIALLCAGTLFAFEYDFFENADSMTSSERRITVQEFFALAGLLIVSLLGFSFWRLRQQKNEFVLRVTAEAAVQVARHQATHDPLTGLPNRRALLDATAAALKDPVARRPHALLLLDLNGFKAINDLHGHAAGDQLLETIARRLQAAVDGDSIAARLGGDEFAVFCANVRSSDDVRDLAQRLVTSIEQPIEIAGNTLRVGTGVGIAFYPQDAETEQDLFRRADAALYRAKATNQSAVRCHALGLSGQPVGELA